MKEKKKVKANELKDAEVQFISIVPKGANRMPISILKSENKIMKGFESIFGKEVSQPYVASIMVSKDVDIKEAEARIKKSGFSVDQKEEQDEMIVFKQKTAPQDIPHQYVVKMDEEIAVHVVCAKSFNPIDFETTSFKELFAKANVLPNIFAAHEVLKEVIMNALFAEDTKSSGDASKKVKKALNEFSTIVTGMVENIPVSAFKMEDPEVIKAVKEELGENMDTENDKEEGLNEDEEDLKKQDGGEGEESDEDEEDSEEDAGDEDSDEESEEDADDPESEGDADDEGEDEEEEEDSEEEEVEKSESKKSKSKSKKTDLEGLVTKMAEQVESLTKSVSGLEKKLESGLSELGGRVDEVSEIAKSADEAINGVTNTDPEGDRTVTTKSEEKPDNDLVDTGFRSLG